jgi:hypothetical protein
LSGYQSFVEVPRRYHSRPDRDLGSIEENIMVCFISAIVLKAALALGITDGCNGGWAVAECTCNGGLMDN